MRNPFSVTRAIETSDPQSLIEVKQAAANIAKLLGIQYEGASAASSVISKIEDPNERINSAIKGHIADLLDELVYAEFCRRGASSPVRLHRFETANLDGSKLNLKFDTKSILTAPATLWMMRDMLFGSLGVDITQALTPLFGDNLPPWFLPMDSSLRAQNLESEASALFEESGAKSRETAKAAYDNFSDGEKEKREAIFEKRANNIMYTDWLSNPQTQKMAIGVLLVLGGVAAIGASAVLHGGGAETFLKAYLHFGKHIGLALSGDVSHHREAIEEAGGIAASALFVGAGYRYGTSGTPATALTRAVRERRQTIKPEPKNNTAQPEDRSNASSHSCLQAADESVADSRANDSKEPAHAQPFDAAVGQSAKEASGEEAASRPSLS